MFILYLPIRFTRLGRIILMLISPFPTSSFASIFCRNMINAAPWTNLLFSLFQIFSSKTFVNNFNYVWNSYNKTSNNLEIIKIHAHYSFRTIISTLALFCAASKLSHALKHSVAMWNIFVGYLRYFLISQLCHFLFCFSSICLNIGEYGLAIMGIFLYRQHS